MFTEIFRMMKHTFTKIFRMLTVATITFTLASSASAATIFFQGGFSDDLFSLDTVSGTETFIGDMGLADSWGFSFSPDGTLYGFHRATSSLYTINTTNASTTLIGATNLTGVEALTFNSSGSELFVTSGSNLFSLDPSNANATSIGNIGTSIDGLTVAPFATSVSGIGVVPAGSIFGVDTRTLYLIDVVTPGSTSIGNVNGADETLAFGPDGTLYGHDDNGAFFEIGLDPLSSTFLASTTPDDVFASAVQPDGPSRVPVPPTPTLLVLGFTGLIAATRRRS